MTGGEDQPLLSPDHTLNTLVELAIAIVATAGSSTRSRGRSARQVKNVRTLPETEEPE